MSIDSRADRDDAGLSLVELLVALVVGAVLLSLVATVFANSLRSDAAARDRDLATGRAQAISTSLTTSIRNSRAVTVQGLADGGTVLRAVVAKGESSWECRAWAVVDLATSDAGGRRAGADGRFELRMLTSTPLTPAAAPPIPAISWGVLADDVERAGTGTAPLPFFSETDGTVSWTLVVAVSVQPQVSDRALVPVSGAAVALARQTGGTARCW